MLAISSMRTFGRARGNESGNTLQECMDAGRAAGLSADTSSNSLQVESMSASEPVRTDKVEPTIPSKPPAESEPSNASANWALPSDKAGESPEVLKRKRHPSNKEIENGSIVEPVVKRQRSRKTLYTVENEEEERDSAKKGRRSRKKQFDIDAGDKIFTDNFEEVCKCACKYCEKVITVDEFRVHLRVDHSETIHDYRNKFGEMQFVSLTYHR